MTMEEYARAYGSAVEPILDAISVGLQGLPRSIQVQVRDKIIVHHKAIIADWPANGLSMGPGYSPQRMKDMGFSVDPSSLPTADTSTGLPD